MTMTCFVPKFKNVAAAVRVHSWDISSMLEKVVSRKVIYHIFILFFKVRSHTRKWRGEGLSCILVKHVMPEVWWLHVGHAEATFDQGKIHAKRNMESNLLFQLCTDYGSFPTCFKKKLWKTLNRKINKSRYWVTPHGVWYPCTRHPTTSEWDAHRRSSSTMETKSTQYFHPGHRRNLC